MSISLRASHAVGLTPRNFVQDVLFHHNNLTTFFAGLPNMMWIIRPHNTCFSKQTSTSKEMLRRMVEGQQELEQKVMFQMPVAFWWKLIISLAPTSKKPTTPANSDGEQRVLAFLLKPHFTQPGSCRHKAFYWKEHYQYSKCPHYCGRGTECVAASGALQYREHTEIFSQCCHRQLQHKPFQHTALQALDTRVS